MGWPRAVMVMSAEPGAVESPVSGPGDVGVYAGGGGGGGHSCVVVG